MRKAAAGMGRVVSPAVILEVRMRDDDGDKGKGVSSHAHDFTEGTGYMGTSIVFEGVPADC